MTVNPSRDIGSVTFGTLFQDAYKGLTSLFAELVPIGNYGGAYGTTLSKDNPTINNTWGVQARLNLGTEGRMGKVILDPGQSYNFNTGQYSDPNISATTAKRLNESTAFRHVNESGLTQANKDSARQSQSVLSTLDEMYIGSYQTDVQTSSQLSNLAQAGEVGLNTSGTKTILGVDDNKKSQVKTPTQRALT